MLNEKVIALLNQQVNKELYSAYLYLEISNFYDSISLDGFANWFMIQAQEERDHAMLFYRYLLNNNEKVELKAIEKPSYALTSDLDVLKHGLECYIEDGVNF